MPWNPRRKKKPKFTLTGQDFSAILAGLRMVQDAIKTDPPWCSGAIQDVLTDNKKYAIITTSRIDDLYEALNGGELLIASRQRNAS